VAGASREAEALFRELTNHEHETAIDDETLRSRRRRRRLLPHRAVHGSETDLAKPRAAGRDLDAPVARLGRGRRDDGARRGLAS
jgi:hypothetical protein